MNNSEKTSISANIELEMLISIRYIIVFIDLFSPTHIQTFTFIYTQI